MCLVCFNLITLKVWKSGNVSGMIWELKIGLARGEMTGVKKLHTNPSNFFWGRPKKYLEGFVLSFVSITGLRSQRQFAPKCPFLASGPEVTQVILPQASPIFNPQIIPDAFPDFHTFRVISSQVS